MRNGKVEPDVVGVVDNNTRLTVQKAMRVAMLMGHHVISIDSWEAGPVKWFVYLIVQEGGQTIKRRYCVSPVLEVDQ